MSDYHALRKAIERGDEAGIRRLAALGADVSAADPHWPPLLFLALKAPKWSEGPMRALLELGADPSKKGANGRSLFKSALSYSHNGPGAMAIARMLCEHPLVNVSELDAHQNSLLGICFYAPELIGLMTRRGADPNGPCSSLRVLEIVSKKNDGMGDSEERRPGSMEDETTPMGYASGFGVIGAESLVDELAAAGGDPNAAPKGGCPPLAYLVARGQFHFNYIERILRVGANPDWRYPSCESLLERAAKTAKTPERLERFAALLCQARADLERAGLELEIKGAAPSASRLCL